jgi:hypothetical protein
MRFGDGTGIGKRSEGTPGLIIFYREVEEPDWKGWVSVLHDLLNYTRVREES